MRQCFFSCSKANSPHLFPKYQAGLSNQRFHHNFIIHCIDPLLLKRLLFVLRLLKLAYHCLNYLSVSCSNAFLCSVFSGFNNASSFFCNFQFDKPKENQSVEHLLVIGCGRVEWNCVYNLHFDSWYGFYKLKAP